MDPRTVTKMMILKRLVESIAEERREKNLPAMEKLADRITDDVKEVVLPLLAMMMDNEGTRAPKQSRIRALSED